MEWKRDDDDNDNDNGEGGEKITELLTASPTRYYLISDGVRPRSTDGELQSSKHQSNRASGAGRVHPNGHTSRGDGAGGHRVNPPDTFIVCPSAAIFT
jgi:hypothetical protein